MARREDSGLREWLFRISVTLKGLNAALEVVAGAALFFIKPDHIIRFLTFISQEEILERPHDAILTYLLDAAHHISVEGKLFAAIYLFIHGVAKVALVIALLRNILWAYPAAIAVFGAFIVYQLYRFTLTDNWALVALSVFDAFLILFIWLEYRAKRAQNEART
jgi:uncharacterized membrane protein